MTHRREREQYKQKRLLTHYTELAGIHPNLVVNSRLASLLPI